MTDIKNYGYIETEIPKEMTVGRITEQQREQYRVITEYGEVNAVLKGSYYYDADVRGEFPCVGDFVLLQYNESGDSRIAELLPRNSKFSRADYSGHAAGYVKTIREQVVAANFDYVFILSSLNSDFNVGRIMRYLTLARQSGGEPVVILTKADLIEDFSEQIAQVKEVAADVPVYAVSSYTGYGLDALEKYLQPCKTAVLLGMSGVGKSSLLNAFVKQEVMRVNAIREDDSRGRHTTTYRQLFMLPSGAMIIDTPGMRELGLFSAEQGISAGFAEVEELFAKCRFSDCRHQTEPGCAVLAALEDGSLSAERWERYLAQKRENRFVEDKAEYLEHKHARYKSISKRSKQIKKSNKYKS